MLNRKAAVFTAYAILLWFIGLRGHMYSDFIVYYPLFEGLPVLSELYVGDYLMEPGFIIYSSLIKTIFPNYFVWIFINTAIDLLVFYYVFKRYTEFRILPLIFFIAYMGLSIEFNLYRNVKALDIFLLSIPYLQRRRIVPYMFLNLLGATFHVSSLMYIPMYFFLHRRISKKVSYFMITITSVVFLCGIHWTSALLDQSGFLNEAILEKLQMYSDMDESYGLSFGFVERFLSIFICTVLYNKLVAQNDINIILYNCALAYYCSFTIFADVQVFAERIPLLFIFSYWLLFPNIFALKYNYRRLIHGTLLLLSLSKVFIGSLKSTCFYENLVWGIKSYDEKANIVETYFENMK